NLSLFFRLTRFDPTNVSSNIPSYSLNFIDENPNLRLIACIMLGLRLHRVWRAVYHFASFRLHNHNGGCFAYNLGTEIFWEEGIVNSVEKIHAV
ncbi:MAG: hypothetical protein II554_05480, partial [Bacteroidales bacterium]|nr:hypothetical protein [Bacteroidales bacterium]